MSFGEPAATIGRNIEIDFVQGSETFQCPAASMDSFLLCLDVRWEVWERLEITPAICERVL